MGGEYLQGTSTCRECIQQVRIGPVEASIFEQLRENGKMKDVWRFSP